jgi:hypothetical protein
MTTDKYYYFPTCTKNIKFVKGEKYICLSDVGFMKKNNIYKLVDFENNDWFSPLLFIDNNGNFYRLFPITENKN